jgi:hypothetical protein
MQVSATPSRKPPRPRGRLAPARRDAFDDATLTLHP